MGSKPLEGRRIRKYKRIPFHLHFNPPLATGREAAQVRAHQESDRPIATTAPYLCSYSRLHSLLWMDRTFAPALVFSVVLLSLLLLLFLHHIIPACPDFTSAVDVIPTTDWANHLSTFHLTSCGEQTLLFFSNIVNRNRFCDLHPGYLITHINSHQSPIYNQHRRWPLLASSVQIAYSFTSPAVTRRTLRECRQTLFTPPVIFPKP